VDNPIGAWDIKTFDGIVENLVFLIKHYPFVKIWVFKINKETNGLRKINIGEALLTCIWRERKS
jgi:hypothetical protein